MNDLFDAINKYYPNSNKYTVYNNSIIFTNNDNRYVIKRNINNTSKRYEYLKSRGFDYIPNIVFENEKYYIYSYISSTSSIKEYKIKDIVSLVSLLHSKTVFYKDISMDEIKEIYENIIKKIDETHMYYNDVMSDIDKEIYFSPSNYLLARNISLVFNSLDFSKYMIDNWYKKVKAEGKIRNVFLHNNLSIDHEINSNDKKYLISMDKSYVGICVYDFLSLYKKYYSDYDFNVLYTDYNKKFNLKESEIMLLFSLLFIPNKIDFNNQEIINTKHVSNLCNYLYKTEELFSKNETKYTKEEDNKINK